MNKWNDQLLIEDIFNSRIKPYLSELETRHKSTSNEISKRNKNALFFWVVPTALISFLITYYVIRLDLSWSLGICLPLAFLSIIITYNSSHAAVEEYNTELRDIFMQCVGETHDNFRYERIGTSCDIKKFRLAGMLPRYENSTLTDWVQGSYNGYAFNIVEATITRNDDRYDVDPEHFTGVKPVFCGLLISLESPLKSTGRVTVVRDKGKIRNKIDGAFESGSKIQIPNEQFESFYEAYADHPEKDIDLFNSALIGIFNGLPKIVTTEDIQVVLEDGVMLIAANETKPFLESISVNMSSSQYKDALKNLIRECSIASLLIHQLSQASNPMDT